MKTGGRTRHGGGGDAGDFAVEAGPAEQQVEDMADGIDQDDAGGGWQEYSVPAPIAGNDDFEKEWEKLRPLVLRLFRQLHSSSLD